MPPSPHLEAMYVSFLSMAAIITTSNVTVRKSHPWSKGGPRVHSLLPEAAPRQARAPHALETSSLPPTSRATPAAVSVAPVPTPCRRALALNSLGQVGGWLQRILPEMPQSLGAPGATAQGWRHAGGPSPPAFGEMTGLPGTVR